MQYKISNQGADELLQEKLDFLEGLKQHIAQYIDVEKESLNEEHRLAFYTGLTTVKEPNRGDKPQRYLDNQPAFADNFEQPGHNYNENRSQVNLELEELKRQNNELLNMYNQMQETMTALTSNVKSGGVKHIDDEETMLKNKLMKLQEERLK